MRKQRLLTFFESRWVLLIVLVVFIVCKIPHLHYPFYCDEGWVYAPAVKTMAVNGPSLLPGSIPSAYSRGHPLLFHFLCSLWIKCFGASNVALHAFPLLLSVLFLAGFYERCRRLFGSRVGVFALLLVTTQVIFFVQSSFVLPEVAVAMLAFFSLYYYSGDRLLLTSVMLLLLFYTKESGLVFGAVIGCDALVSLFNRSEALRRRLLRLVSVVVPVLLIALFFAVQKAREGWYVLPLHSSIIHTDWQSVCHMFKESVHCTFASDRSNWLVCLLVIAMGFVPAAMHKSVRYLFLCIPGATVFIFDHIQVKSAVGFSFWLSVLGISFAVALYGLLSINATLSGDARKFLRLLVCCFGAYLCFSSLGALTYRYLLVDVILLLTFLAVCADAFIRAGRDYVFYAAIVGILVIGVCAYNGDAGNDDTDLEAFNAMDVQKEVVAWLEKEDAYDKEITMGCFWETVHLVDTLQGFLSSNRIFTKPNWDTVTAQADYVVFDNVCSSVAYDHIANSPNFRVVYKTRHGRTWAEIYKRIDVAGPRIE